MEFLIIIADFDPEKQKKLVLNSSLLESSLLGPSLSVSSQLEFTHLKKNDDTGLRV